MIDVSHYAPHIADPDEPQEMPADMGAFADAFAQLMGLTIAQDADHDVSGEPRESDGKWTEGGGGGKAAFTPPVKTMQGGAWMIGGALKVNKLLTNDEVVELLTTHGYSKEEAMRETQAANAKVAQDGWLEDQHPRGQPTNKGEFASAPGGGSQTAPATGAWVDKPKAPSAARGPAQSASGSPPASVAEGKWRGGGHEFSPASSLYAATAKKIPSEKQVAKGAEIAEKVGVTEKVARARKMLANGVPTDASVAQGGFMQADGSYTPERREIHKKILRGIFTPEAIAGATPVEGHKPTMTVLGGRGGSGKSWLTGDKGPVSRGNTIIIDADAIKAALPEYKGWNAALLHEESSHIVSLAADMAKSLGVNVTFDATMNTGKSLAKRIAMFSGAGYDAHGYYMYASPETATERAMGRFKSGGETGRFVPPEVIMSNTENEKNFDSMIPQFKHWAVYDNNSGNGPRYVAGDA